MSFLEEVQSHAPKRDLRCSVTRWLDTQTDLTDADVREAAAAVNVASVHRALQGRGFQAGRQSVERHINGSCSCPTS